MSFRILPTSRRPLLRRALLRAPLAAALAFPALGSSAAQPALDVVIVGGRVLDPESGLDAVRHVGVRGGRIASVTSGAEHPEARDTIDARGLVVAPGFV